MGGIKPMLRRYNKEFWIDLTTGEIMTFKQMLASCINDYDFDDYDYESEVFNYFMPLSLYIPE